MSGTKQKFFLRPGQAGVCPKLSIARDLGKVPQKYLIGLIGGDNKQSTIILFLARDGGLMMIG